MRLRSAFLAIVLVTTFAACAETVRAPATRPPAPVPPAAVPAPQATRAPSQPHAPRVEPSVAPTVRPPAPPRRGAALPAPPAGEPIEGFGAGAKGGTGGRVITIDEPTEDAVRAAFADANTTGHAVIKFAVSDTIPIVNKLPILSSPNLTLEGGGATLDGSDMKEGSAIIDIRTNDVIVRNLRLRNGDDNLRLQGPDAYNIAVSHVSSTGSNDDGISIGYGTHDVTLQYSFFAGDTRSIYCKYPGTNDITVHHVWVQKGAIRSPLLSGHLIADVRNVIIEDWGEWGSRFEDGASGNLVNSLYALSPYARSAGGKPHAALRFKDAGDVYTSGNVSRGEVLPLITGTATKPIAAPPVRTQSVAEMEPNVRAHAGCMPRDSVDTAYVNTTSGWQVLETRPYRLSGHMPKVEKRE